MQFEKLDAFTKRVADLPDKPNSQYTASELKEYFDSSPEELRAAFNKLIDALHSQSASKGIGVTPIATGPDNLQGTLEWMKSQIDNVVLGQIPDGVYTDRSEFLVHSTNGDIHKTSTTIRSESTTEFRVEVRSADPTSPAVGRMWLRSDL